MCLSKGSEFLRQGRFSEARDEIVAAIAAGISDPSLFVNLGVACKRLGDLSGALSAIREALAIDPCSPEACFNLGNILSVLGRLDEAINAYYEALHLRPTWAEAYSAIGILLVKQGRLDEALACHEKAFLLKQSWFTAYSLGVVLQRLGSDERALACYQSSLKFFPAHWRSHVNSSLILLKRGDFEQGWIEYEWRLGQGVGAQISGTAQVWDGSRFDGKSLLLLPEQGHGDMIQFVRFASSAKAIGGAVYIECPVSLVRLFSTCPGVDGAFSDKSIREEVDLVVPILSLPRVLNVADRIPCVVPYLTVPQQEDISSVEWEIGRCGSSFNIGVVWEGDRGNPSNGLRSCTPHQFSCLKEVPGIRLFGLQFDTDRSKADLKSLGIESLGCEMGDFSRAALIASRMDLIVTVDTSMAHLAGSLGLPVWVSDNETF